MTMEAESGGMCVQAKEHQRLPVTTEAGRQRKDSSLEASEGVQPFPRLDFGLPASRLGQNRFLLL